MCPESTPAILVHAVLQDVCLDPQILIVGPKEKEVMTPIKVC